MHHRIRYLCFYKFMRTNPVTFHIITLLQYTRPLDSIPIIREQKRISVITFLPGISGQLEYGSIEHVLRSHAREAYIWGSSCVAPYTTSCQLT